MSFQSVLHGNEVGRTKSWNGVGAGAVWTGTAPGSRQHELETESGGQFVRAARRIKCYY